MTTPRPPEAEVLQTLRDRLMRDQLDGVAVTCRISGGIREQAGQEVTLSVDSAARARMGEEEIRSLFRTVSAGLDGMTPRSQARFLPDSRLATVIVELDGGASGRAEWSVLMTEVDRQVQGKPVTADAEAAIARLLTLANTMQDGQGEPR